MIRQSFLVCCAGLLVGLAACDQSTGLSTQISQDDANQLAADMDGLATLGTADYGLGASFSVSADGSGSSASVSAAPIAIDNQFTVTRQCPRGGQVMFAGRTTGTGDRTTHSLTLATTATRTDTDCAFQTRNGVLTLNGSIDFTGNLNIVNGLLSGLQTQTHKGSFTWARTGGSGSCDVDLTSQFDPATHTVTVTGMFCGRTVNVTRTRSG